MTIPQPVSLNNRIDAFLEHTPDCDKSPTHPDDIHDRSVDLFRDLLISYDWAISSDEPQIIDTDYADLPDLVRTQLFALVDELMTNRYERDLLTDYALRQSLCPLHFVDYAICFDDANPECDQIRTIHPAHDS